ncbi:Vacuolar protein 8 [Holothuria leucospilota]|uniref:Vacuolar protein 8 n=1 Tax=Holothuria leucospilota TaxID=206669 RepID=A0A9Q0YDI0_HOLLE|nr:Vacuolar protein 8 [Holothuria leucospilota]
MDTILDYCFSYCCLCCGCYGSRPFDDDAYEPLLQDEERAAVNELLTYLNREHEMKPVLTPQRLRALCILTYSENADLQRSAALCLAEISERLLQPLTPELMEPVLALLESEDIETQKAASLAVSNFALVGPDSNKEVIVDSDTLPVLIRLLNASDLEVQCNACGCITTLATSNQNKGRIVACGAVSPLIKLARASDIRVQRNATGALLNLTHLEKNREILVACGAVKVFVDLLSSNDTDIQYYCAAALSNLAVDEKHRPFVVREGNHKVLKLLIGLLESLSDKVICQACFALRNLSSEGDNQLAVVEFGALPHLLQIMRKCSKETLAAAVAALRNLSIHKSNEIPIVKEGFIPELGRVLREPYLWDAHCHAAGTLRNLAAGSKTKLILEQDGLDSLTAAFVESTSPVSVQREVTAALAVIAGNADARQRLLDLGNGRVFTRLVSLAAQSTSSEVQYNSAGTLGQLTQLDIPRDVMQNNLPSMLKYLRSFLDSEETNFVHVSLWTILHLLKDSSFKEQITTGLMRQKVQTIYETPSTLPQIKQLALDILQATGEPVSLLQT